MNETRFALVMDASPAVRNFVSSVLRQDDRIANEIVVAESPDHALSLLAQMSGRLQFIVSDSDLPGMPLPEFMARINQAPQLAGAPIFLLTDEAENHNLIKVTGADAILQKPFTPEQLVALVVNSAQVMERRRAQRVVPLVCCEVNLGFGNEAPIYSAAIINISESGMLLRSPLPVRGIGHVYDMASLSMFAENCAPIKLHGQVVRIEAETRSGGQFVRIAFKFEGLDQASDQALRNFILLNNPTDERAHS